MGGNAKFGDQSGDKISVVVIGRAQLVEIIGSIANILDISTEFWYCGSSEHLVDTQISDEELIKYKPTFGDIDLLVDLDSKGKVEAILKEKPEGLLGWKRTGGQIVTLWDTDIGNLQIDLCFTEFVMGYPSEWGLYSRSSSWDDMKLGIRGVYHKMFLRALTSLSVQPVGEDGKLSNTLAFSVQRGIREKYVLNENGYPETLLKPSDSTYYTDLNDILMLLYGVVSHCDSQIENMWSLTGLISNMDYSPKFYWGARNEVMKGFVEILLGEGSQKFQQDESGDREEKLKVIGMVAEMMYPRVPNWIEELTK